MGAHPAQGVRFVGFGGLLDLPHRAFQPGVESLVHGDLLRRDDRARVHPVPDAGEFGDRVLPRAEGARQLSAFPLSRRADVDDEPVARAAVPEQASFQSPCAARLSSGSAEHQVLWGMTLVAQADVSETKVLRLASVG
ncbi:hypothetical protein [Streptomyces specialis]|uniref:hypothetical protein n=1 Tax=Streptomyces specialis TaxID=498367 RepID=UPI00131EA93D|nr:hypothetical protein [Streptomyces specialis]